MDEELNGTSGSSGEGLPIMINDDPMGTSGLNGTSGLENT